MVERRVYELYKCKICITRRNDRKIQKYVNGVNLYIPKIPEKNNICSSYKLELYRRNQEIYELFLQGEKVSELAAKYYLSDKSIYRILNRMKKK